MLYVRQFISAICLLGLTATALASPAAIVRAYMDAYNAHDIDAMLALVSEDLTWFTVEQDEVRTEIEGTYYLELGMTGYFQAMPESRSEIRALSVSGNFVSVVEQAYWQSDGEIGTQCALAVYQIEDERIRRVWYYEAHPCDPQ